MNIHESFFIHKYDNVRLGFVFDSISSGERILRGISEREVAVSLCRGDYDSASDAYDLFCCLVVQKKNKAIGKEGRQTCCIHD